MVCLLCSVLQILEGIVYFVGYLCSRKSVRWAMWAFTWWQWFVGWLSSSPWQCKVLHTAHLCSFDPLSLHINLKSFNISFLQVRFLVRWSFLLLNNASLIINAFFYIFHFQTFRKFNFLSVFVHFITIIFIVLCLSLLYNCELCVPLHISGMYTTQLVCTVFVLILKKARISYVKLYLPSTARI